MAKNPIIVERYPRICAACKHLKGDSAQCSAYPQGVPEDIFWEQADHREKRDDQKNDVTFDLRDGGEEDLKLYEQQTGNGKKSKLQLAAESLLDLLHDRY